MDMLAVAVLALELVDITEVERSLRAVSHTDGLSPLWETYQTYQSPEVPFFGHDYRHGIVRSYALAAFG